MRQEGLKAKRIKAFRPRTTIRVKEELIAPNHLARLSFDEIKAVDQFWVSDITYVPTAEGWLFLAAIMELKSRKIGGWTLEGHMHTSVIEKPWSELSNDVSRHQSFFFILIEARSIPAGRGRTYPSPLGCSVASKSGLLNKRAQKILKGFKDLISFSG